MWWYVASHAVAFVAGGVVSYLYATKVLGYVKDVADKL